MCLLLPSGYVVLCERALPGEELVAEITLVKKGYAEAIKKEVLKPHANAVTAHCRHFGPCGGCTLQSLQYEMQLQEKQQQIEQMLQRVGKVSNVQDVVQPIKPCNQLYHYRNKMQFCFSSKNWNPAGTPSITARPTLGMLQPGNFENVLPIESCSLQDDSANAILKVVREECCQPGPLWPVLPSGEMQAVLQHLVIRRGRAHPAAAPNYMVIISSTQQPPELSQLMSQLASKIVAAVPAVVSVIHAISEQPTSAGSTTTTTGGGHGSSRQGARGRGGARPRRRYEVLHGRSTISDVLGGVSFDISSESFFQTNTEQAQVLVDLVRSAAQLRGSCRDVLLDLYCGTGTFGLALAAHVSHVYGYDISGPAIADAARTAARNGITNATFRQGDLEKIALDLVPDQLRQPPGDGGAARGAKVRSRLPRPPATAESLPVPDVVVVDPARAGLERKVVEFLNKCGARRVVYVSCNVATQARDLDRLCHGTAASPGPWRLVSVQGCDMFPHTDHVEVVAVLERV